MRRPGFTLMELTIVTSLIALTLAVSFPFLHFFQQTSTLRTVSLDLYQTLTVARHRAQTSERGSAWGVRIFSDSYVLYAGNAYADRTDAYDETHDVHPSIAMSGLSEVIFRKRLGAPVLPGTIILSDVQGDSVSLIVNAAGGISAPLSQVVQQVTVTQRFDFNSSYTNITAADFTGVVESRLFTPSNGYGWVVAPQGIDRSGAGGKTTVALYQDGHAGFSNTTGTFRVNLPNGTYDVRAYAGDRFQHLNGIQVRAEASAWTPVPAVSYNNFTTATFTVTVTDGILDFQVTQIPGNSAGWVLNGLDIASTGALPPVAP